MRVHRVPAQLHHESNLRSAPTSSTRVPQRPTSDLDSAFLRARTCALAWLAVSDARGRMANRQPLVVSTRLFGSLSIRFANFDGRPTEAAEWVGYTTETESGVQCSSAC